MKKILSRKIFALAILLTLTFNFAASPALAQDVQLLPNASGDYEVQTSPYEGQDYQIRQAQVGAWTYGILAALTNRLLGTVAEEMRDNVASWVGQVIEAVIINGAALIGGEAILEFSEGGGGGGEDVSYNPSNTGALGTTALLIDGVLQNQPNLQTAAFFRNTLANNILSQTASAQTDEMGTVFFEPVRHVWLLTRNLAYIFFAAILILMGLMVMLRYRIDPRTTMTVTAALPRIAASLVLIAFSYPLAGIIFDAARLLKYMIDALFKPIFALVGQDLVPIQPFLVTGRLIQQINIKTVYLGGSGLFSAFVILIVWLIVLFVAFSLFFILVIRFANLFVQLITAPLAFLWGALPGQEDTTTRWFKSFLVNTLTFPIIYFLINFALLITYIGVDTPFGLPPGLGSEEMWALPRNVAGLVAFGILLAATRVPEILEDAFEVAPSAHVAKAGVEPMKTVGRLPLIGGLFK